MQIAGKKPGAWRAMASGMGLVIQRQRVVWWLFLANFILGLIAVLPVRLTLGQLLDHSVASRSLADHFDLSAFVEVLSSPQFSFDIFRSLSLFTSAVFALVVLFAEPGVIQEFRHAAGVNAPSRRQSAGEFFGACGEFLLRMVRLLLWSLLLLVAFAVVFAVVSTLAPGNPPSETTALKSSLLLGLVFFLLFAFVRLWISVAEIELMATGEPATRRTLFRAAPRLTFSNFGPLYTIQLVTSIATVVVTLLGLMIWIKFVPPTAVGMAFIVSELTLLLLLACRLWQRASLVIWYERWVGVQPKPAEQPLPPMHQEPPVEVVVGSPITSQAPSEAPPAAAPTAPDTPDDNPPGPASGLS
jgi:hypothetical protein